MRPNPRPLTNDQLEWLAEHQGGYFYAARTQNRLWREWIITTLRYQRLFGTEPLDDVFARYQDHIFREI